MISRNYTWNETPSSSGSGEQSTRSPTFATKFNRKQVNYHRMPFLRPRYITSNMILETKFDIHHFQQASSCTFEVEDQPQPGREGRAAGGEEVNCLRAAPTILGLGAIPVSTSIRPSWIRFRDLRDWPGWCRALSSVLR